MNSSEQDAVNLDALQWGVKTLRFLLNVEQPVGPHRAFEAALKKLIDGGVAASCNCAALHGAPEPTGKPETGGMSTVGANPCDGSKP